MGLFKKKPDPISERAKALNDQIAALEVQIQRLSEAKDQPAENVEVAPAIAAPSAASPFSAKTSSAAIPTHNPTSPQPRLRSTAVPYGQAAAQAAAAGAQSASRKAPEPVFENIEQNRIKTQPEAATTAAHFNELGVRKYDLPALWRRVRNHFRGPATNNPKLVNYLAAGSIQGLRPLRYEKRVARNRFLFLVIILIVVLWGIISFFIRRS
jgi:hypothetical protein